MSSKLPLTMAHVKAVPAQLHAGPQLHVMRPRRHHNPQLKTHQRALTQVCPLWTRLTAVPSNGYMPVCPKPNTPKPNAKRDNKAAWRVVGTSSLRGNLPQGAVSPTIEASRSRRPPFHQIQHHSLGEPPTSEELHEGGPGVEPSSERSSGLPRSSLGLGLRAGVSSHAALPEPSRSPRTLATHSSA